MWTEICKKCYRIRWVLVIKSLSVRAVRFKWIAKFGLPHILGWWSTGKVLEFVLPGPGDYSCFVRPVTTGFCFVLMIAAENVKVQEEIIASPLGLYNILASICSIFDKGESQNLHNSLWWATNVKRNPHICADYAMEIKIVLTASILTGWI